jgi:uncharacterized membrane protein
LGSAISACSVANFPPSRMGSLTFYNLLKALHILSAIAFAGGIFSRQIVRMYAKRTDDVVRFATLNEAALDVENWLVKPGSFVILALGVALAWRGGIPMFGVLQGQSQNWLLVSNILFVVGMLLVPTVFIPRGRRFRPLLDAALAQRRMTPELKAALDDPVVNAAHTYEIVMLLAIVALMTLKSF